MMVRRIKLDEVAGVYHCIARVVGGEMLLGNEEKERFRRLMWKVAAYSGVEIITYCVMTNHVHLLVRVRPVGELSDREICQRLVAYHGLREPWVQVVKKAVDEGGAMAADVRRRILAQMGDVSMFMRTLKQRFSRWYNRKHKRFGTFWAERFKSVLIEDASESLRTVAMYIDLNPVRAGLVDDPKDYRFCGHAEAMAGNRSIRQTMAPLCEGRNWRQMSGEYRCRMMVYAGESKGRGKRALGRAKVLEVLNRGGAVETGELLRLRIRYFSDGVVFGSHEFVESMFAEFRNRFGKRRTSGARRLRGVGTNLSPFATARDLQKQALG